MAAAVMTATMEGRHAEAVVVVAVEAVEVTLHTAKDREMTMSMTTEGNADKQYIDNISLSLYRNGICNFWLLSFSRDCTTYRA